MVRYDSTDLNYKLMCRRVFAIECFHKMAISNLDVSCDYVFAGLKPPSCVLDGTSLIQQCCTGIHLKLCKLHCCYLFLAALLLSTDSFVAMVNIKRVSCGLRLRNVMSKQHELLANRFHSFFSLVLLLTHYSHAAAFSNALILDMSCAGAIFFHAKAYAELRNRAWISDYVLSSLTSC